MDEVIVTSSRTYSRIDDLPTKVEVIGSEEMDEETGILPGNITGLLGDVAGIQNQHSSATSGNVELRVQGLPGKYTQLLRDGLPLFGGYSGSFSILQIPPLDLKQLEIIKGSGSTLYGGGAIAGMINLVSKTPLLKRPEYSFLINHSSLNETNINTYLSNRGKHAGYSIFGGTTLQRAVDVNKDGFSDVPDLENYFLHPRFFFYPDASNTITVGYHLTTENRTGGDMQVLHNLPDSLHRFFIRNRSTRQTIDGEWEQRLNKTDRLVLKGNASFYNREILTNGFGMGADQLSYYTELTYFKKLPRHSIVAGFNQTGERFSKRNPDSTNIEPYHQNSTGFFVQDDWKISQLFTLQAGFRLDHNSNYGNFPLPRLSMLYRINNHFTTRLGGGTGYQLPSVFNNDLEERDYLKIIPGSLAGVGAERSIGANWDINYKRRFGEYTVTVNQMFYFTAINDPVVPSSLSSGGIYFYNGKKPLNTRGSETYIQIREDELELYLGYTYTVAKQLYNTAQSYLPLSARNKFATVIAYEFNTRVKANFEISYNGKQYLDNGQQTPGYIISAAMLRYSIQKISFVLNCENLFDYRQTKKENIVIPPLVNPSFKQIWGPLEGRVVNFSVNIRW